MEKLVILNSQRLGKDIHRCHIQDANEVLILNEVWILNEVYARSKTQVMKYFHLNIYPTPTQENAQWELKWDLTAHEPLSLGLLM